MNCYVKENGIEPGQSLEEKQEDDGLQMNFTEPAKPSGQGQLQAPSAPAQNQQQAPSRASESEFQQSQPLAQPVVRSDA